MPLEVCPLRFPAGALSCLIKYHLVSKLALMLTWGLRFNQILPLIGAQMKSGLNTTNSVSFCSFEFLMQSTASCNSTIEQSVFADPMFFFHFRAVLGESWLKQESPPAWTQEAYRPPCSEYSFCCPTWVPPPGRVPPPPSRVPPSGRVSPQVSAPWNSG